MKDFSLEAFRNGSTSEMKKLFLHHCKRLFFIAMAVINDRDTAESIVTDSMMSLWDSRHKIKDEAHLRAFLFITVRNKAIDEVRRKRSARTTLVDEFPEVREQGDVEIIRKHLLDLVAGLVEKLSPKRKEIVYLHYFVGLSVKEISKMMGIEQSTVYNHLQKAIGDIKGMLPNNVF